MRRAARHGKLLDIEGEFLSSLCEVVIAENKSAYPELDPKRNYIKKIISIEEERFEQTIDSGLRILAQCIDKAKKTARPACPARSVPPLRYLRLPARYNEGCCPGGGHERR